MITVTNLRKIFTEQGVKGASKWKRENFEAEVAAAEFAAYDEDMERSPKPVAAPIAKGKCTECGRKEDFRASGLCELCRSYGEWENAHSDNAHEGNGAASEQDEKSDCWVCHPELDERNPKANRGGQSRAGMVIVAKGSEVHKSLTFKAMAEATGWTVTILQENGRTYADAHKDGNAIQLAWEGRAYDYSSSSANFGGKARKVRNLKEATRLL